MTCVGAGVLCDVDEEGVDEEVVDVEDVADVPPVPVLADEVDVDVNGEVTSLAPQIAAFVCPLPKELFK